MRKPKAATQASTADTTPMRPSQGLVRTQSAIMTVLTLKNSMMAMVTPKNGITELVLFSSSVSSVRDTKRATLIVPKSLASKAFSRDCSHKAALKGRGKEGRSQ